MLSQCQEIPHYWATPLHITHSQFIDWTLIRPHNSIHSLAWKEWLTTPNGRSTKTSNQKLIHQKMIRQTMIHHGPPQTKRFAGSFVPIFAWPLGPRDGGTGAPAARKNWLNKNFWCVFSARTDHYENIFEAFFLPARTITKIFLKREPRENLAKISLSQSCIGCMIAKLLR